MARSIKKSILYGTLASIILLGVYFAVLTFVSGWVFAEKQFASYWYFIVSLTVGFGIQIGLYSYLKELVKNKHITIDGKAVAVTGTTSTLAMVSCCAHYLTNIIPILGISGSLMFITKYQTEIFWVGILFNIFGIIFISNKIIKIKKTNI
ncbi:MAG: hypothetical protein WCW54_01095 [Candidatus Paceibacterota bacterium]